MNGFDRTYEELKPTRTCDARARSISRFDRTYEELKPDFLLDRLFRPIRGFDRTYEELKHRRPYHLHLSVSGQVLIVPMRN